MNRDIPGDSFTLEDIIKEFGGGKKNAAPEQTLPDGLSLSDIEQELRDLLGEDDLPAQDAAPETLPEPEKLPETEETPEPEAQPEPEAVSAPEARTEAEEVPDTAQPEPEKPSEPGEPPAVTEEPDGQLHAALAFVPLFRFSQRAVLFLGPQRKIIVSVKIRKHGLLGLHGPFFEDRPTLFPLFDRLTKADRET